MSNKFNRLVVGFLVVKALVGAPSLVAAQPLGPAIGEGTAPPTSDKNERLIVVAKSDAEYDQLRQEVQKAGGSILKDMRAGGMLVISGSGAVKAHIEASGRAKGVARDHLETLIPPGAQPDMLNDRNSSVGRRRTLVDSSTSAAIRGARQRTVAGDPGVSVPGLMWNLFRIHAPQAWQTTIGSSAVKVGVADTGVDFTHTELQNQVESVVDFTTTENPPICASQPNPIDPGKPGIGDPDLAKMFGGPVTTDWNGHGSWIGGNIAAALDGTGINGIAPGVKLVSLKISGWCGSAYDSTILDAFLYAGSHHIDVVSISFGGYLDLRQSDQAIIWGQYIQVVQQVRDQGTTIVAAAGNEHVRIGASGLVLSHGPLTTPGNTPAQFAAGDIFGQFEVPGGVPGVVDVSSTGNVVVPSSTTCMPPPSSSDANAVCKPNTDAHQAAGQGTENQLSYFSNYGPRIDVAAPGGARKFNLPTWDRGGTPGFPYTTADWTTVFEAFSTTSNWSNAAGFPLGGIPCYTFTGGGFPANQCYTVLQGTSMATPHASGALALIASKNEAARHNPAGLIQILKSSTSKISGNTTQVLSATDTSAADRTGVACASGYCHLGGAAIADTDAYGAGLVNAEAAVKATSP